MLVVERDRSGVRLHDLLAEAWPDAHRGDIRQLVASGEVSVNGDACVSDRKLRLGDVVMVQNPPTSRRTGASRRPAVDDSWHTKRQSNSRPVDTATCMI